VRVRFGKERRRFRIPTVDVDLATSRAKVLIGLGAQLADVPSELARDLLEQAGAADGPELKRIKGVVEKLASGAVKVRRKVENPRTLWTVRELGEASSRYTSNRSSMTVSFCSARSGVSRSYSAEKISFAAAWAVELLAEARVSNAARVLEPWTKKSTRTLEPRLPVSC
jgi:hypothetical protein